MVQTIIVTSKNLLPLALRLFSFTDQQVERIAIDPFTIRVKCERERNLIAVF